MDRVLVTGGLGFIGSNFIRSAFEKGKAWDIVNLDCISYGAAPQSLSDLRRVPNYHFIKGDITDIRLVQKLVRGAAVIVHFAAETHVDRSISDPQSFLRSNVLGTFVLLEAARRSDVKTFVHISTDEVYGPAKSNISFRENDRLRTTSPYSASKASADMFVEAYHHSYGLRTVTMRSVNNFGPRQFPEKFIPKTLINALLGKKVAIYGNGMQVRDWIYVIDFCEAIDLAIDKGKPGSVYNISAGNELPNVQVAQQILELLDKPFDLIQFGEDRPGHDLRYSLESSLIRNEMGWKPEHDFRLALKETVAWYTNNEWWWKPLINEKILSPTPWKEEWRTPKRKLSAKRHNWTLGATAK